VSFDRAKLLFKTSIVVRNYEVDWQGIVHNATYLLYCEIGRIEYLRRMGVLIDPAAIRKESLIVVARNEIDYLRPVGFGEELMVLSRIASIGESSFRFESMIETAQGGDRVAENTAVHVWLDQLNGRPTAVPDWFRENVRKWEGKNVSILGGKP